MKPMPMEITDAEFQDKVLHATVPVLVDFWAPWCGPCRMVAPVLEELAAERQGELLVAKVNVDHEKTNAGRYGVQGIPTMILFDGGREVDRIVGALNKDGLRRRIDRALGAKVE